MFKNGLIQVQDDATEIVDEFIGDLATRFAPLTDYFQGIYDTVLRQAFSAGGGIEIGVIVVAGALAWLLASPSRKLLHRLWPASDMPRSARARDVVKGLMLPIVWVILLWSGMAASSQLGIGSSIIRIAASLLNAWIIIRLVSSFVKDQTLARGFAALAWFVAALNILGLLRPTIDLLDSVGFSFGDARLTLFSLIKGALLAVLFVWAASATSGLVQNSLRKSQRLTPSVRTLVAQGARLTLLFIAIMLAMSAIGIDLTALAVFSGAIGVGIGFGLQSIFSNLMAGIIMLLEKTIKVGDFVEFDNGLAGEVREINVRATLVTTNDNVDILVPNSQFIENRVTNWTLREGFRRIRISFGVAYGTDKDLVKKAALEAAEAVPHNLTGTDARDPQVWLVGFGDSSLDFELVVWLKPEAVKRPSAVQADYNWAIETALSKYGIEIPFPQRDLHFRSGKVPVLVGEGES